MKKIFLALLLVALATMTIPSLRQEAQPHLDEIGEYLGEKLEGPLSPILNPYRRLQSQSEMGEAVRELIQDRNTGYVRPTPDGFRDFMRREVEDEDGLDAWGTPYILIPEPDSVTIMSAGPDLEYETDDDVTVKIRYGAPAYLPSRRR